MIVAFANNQALSALDDQPSTITTDPHPVGDANYIEATFFIHVLFTQMGSVTLSYKMQGSNDGQNWFDISGFGGNQPGPTPLPVPMGGDVTCAFVRVEFELLGAGGGSGISAANYDLHANFIHK